MQLSIITVASQSLVYIPVLEALADKLNLEGDYVPLIGCVSPVQDHTTFQLCDPYLVLSECCFM